MSTALRRIGVVLTNNWHTLTVRAVAREGKGAVHRRVEAGAKGPHNDKKDTPDGAMFLLWSVERRAAGIISDTGLPTDTDRRENHSDARPIVSTLSHTCAKETLPQCAMANCSRQPMMEMAPTAMAKASRFVQSLSEQTSMATH